MRYYVSPLIFAVFRFIGAASCLIIFLIVTATLFSPLMRAIAEIPAAFLPAPLIFARLYALCHGCCCCYAIRH